MVMFVAMIGEFWSTLSVSVFHGLLFDNVIMIDISKKRNFQVGFEFSSLCVIERCNNSNASGANKRLSDDHESFWNQMREELEFLVSSCYPLTLA